MYNEYISLRPAQIDYLFHGSGRSIFIAFKGKKLVMCATHEPNRKQANAIYCSVYTMATATSVWLSVVLKCDVISILPRTIANVTWQSSFVVINNIKVKRWISLFYFGLPAWSLLKGKKSIKQKNPFGLA